MSATDPVAPEGDARPANDAALWRAWERFDLLAVVALAALAYRGVAMSEPLRSTIPAAERFFFHPTQNAPDMTLLAMVGLLLADWRRLSGRVGRAPASAFAFVLLPLSVALHLWAVHTQALPVDLLSLGVFLVGGALLLGGWPMARMVLLPATLVLVAIPVPVVLINQLVPPLQSVTIALSTSGLALLGRDHQVVGDIIYTGGRAFQVVDTCTGLRSLSTLYMATLVYTRVFQKRGWRAGVLLALAAPISILFNGVRVLSVMLSADLTLAEDHTLQGIAVMVASVLALHAIAQGVDRFWPAPPAAPARRPAAVTGRRWRVAVVLVTLAVSAVAAELVPVWKPAPTLSAWSVRMPVDWEGYKARLIEVDTTYLGSVEFDRHLQRRYEREGEPWVEVLLAMQRRVGRDGSLQSEKLGTLAGHFLLSDREVELEAVGPVRETVIRGREGVRLVYTWYRGTDGFGTELLRSLFALDRSDLHREGGAWVLRVSTPVESDADLAPAAERLSRFAAFLEDLLPEAVGERSP